jgi:ATP-dependent RNA circularization protein (DNA/RNA ligase family)
MKVKYPRTYHFPWSPGRSSDDKVLKSTEHFQGKQVIVTEKMDGESCSMYRDGSHARSLSSSDHYSRHQVKAIHSTIKNDIPEGWRICGENLAYCKSILYTDLEAFFYVFSIWTDKNECLPWCETKEWCALLGIPTVKTLWNGIYDEEAIKNIKINTEKQEGYVVRLTNGFHYDDFGKSVAKYVRTGHVQSGDHWMHQQLIPNKLKV